jgi:hypothetical protein
MQEEWINKIVHEMKHGEPTGIDHEDIPGLQKSIPRQRSLDKNISGKQPRLSHYYRFITNETHLDLIEVGDSLFQIPAISCQTIECKLHVQLSKSTDLYNH